MRVRVDARDFLVFGQMLRTVFVFVFGQDCARAGVILDIACLSGVYSLTG
jgi:hypothetical protein